MKTILTSGNRAVVINQSGNYIWANVYVNIGQGIEHADITMIRWEGKTLAGAKRWAEKQLA